MPASCKNLRKRIARIRVFDPACGSGNFLVIAYKEMRAIEAEINRRRGEDGRKTEIPLTNFRGIESRTFAAEIARLALIIAEFQCDALYRGQKEALRSFCRWIRTIGSLVGNALRLDWLSICPPDGRQTCEPTICFDTPLRSGADRLRERRWERRTFAATLPISAAHGKQTNRKQTCKRIFEDRTNSWKSLDYVAGWFIKAAEYGTQTNAARAFVSTNSICQGQQVPILWPLIFDDGAEIASRTHRSNGRTLRAIMQA